jgi:lipopolysaccharide/colanic/teichoic acid biosynthesis glycosyltransferase
MRWLVLLVADIALLLLATFFALLLRENFEVAASRFVAFLPYLLATLASAFVVFPVAGLNRFVWRFSSFHDHMVVTGAVAVAATAAAGMAFAYNRLDGVARSLPFLQFLTGTALLIGARVLHRLAHEFSHNRKAAPAMLRPQLQAKAGKIVLIAGMTRLADAYLRAAAEMPACQIHIAGIIARKERYAGRLLSAHRVLGSPENLVDILDSLELHGVNVDVIAVAAPFRDFSPEAQQALLAAERARAIELRFLAEDWGLSVEHPGNAPARIQSSASTDAPHFEISPALLDSYGRRRYWIVKRIVDVAGAAVLMLLLSPVMLVAAFLVAATAGFPVLFWQQRPGLGGRPFRVYKFRTMRSAHKSDGCRLSDRERVSRVGELLRRLRLDELPQLFNIIRGDMSFIGPRPLLSQDQSAAYCARLLVRPGLTGWAQVVGGRDIPPVDKAALDVWYVCNASFALDAEIVLRTIPFVLFGERISMCYLERAWQELGEGGMIVAEASTTSRKQLAPYCD